MIIITEARGETRGLIYEASLHTIYVNFPWEKYTSYLYYESRKTGMENRRVFCLQISAEARGGQ